jgi:hypothetical protein
MDTVSYVNVTTTKFLSYPLSLKSFFPTVSVKKAIEDQQLIRSP